MGKRLAKSPAHVQRPRLAGRLRWRMLAGKWPNLERNLTLLPALPLRRKSLLYPSTAEIRFPEFAGISSSGQTRASAAASAPQSVTDARLRHERRQPFRLLRDPSGRSWKSARLLVRPHSSRPSLHALLQSHWERRSCLLLREWLRVQI